MSQVYIRIQVDGDYVPEALRELADLAEERAVAFGQEMCDYDFATETYHYTAEFTEE